MYLFMGGAWRKFFTGGNSLKPQKNALGDGAILSG